MSFQINNSNSKAYLFLTLSALFWSGNFIVGKAASSMIHTHVHTDISNFIYAGLGWSVL